MANPLPAGVPARDTKTHTIIINWMPEFRDGVYRMTPVGTFAFGNGDWFDDRPTDHYYIIVNADGQAAVDWVFDEVVIDGATVAEGIFISPAGGISIEFANPDRTAVKLSNECSCDWFRHEWFAYLRNTTTGERIDIRPGGQNGDGPTTP